MCSLGPQHYSGDKGLTAQTISLFVQLLFQDVQFCLPNASTCYTAISQETFDCDISCTGLYADVVFSEDKILNLKTNLVTTSLDSSRDWRLKVEQGSNGKERQSLLKLLRKYTDYKQNFVRQIKFISSQPNLSKYVHVKT